MFKRLCIVPDCRLEESTKPHKCTRIFKVPDVVLWPGTVPRKYNRMWECTVHDSGHEESTVACKLKRLCTVPDVGLEESTVPLKWNRLFTVPDVVL